MVSAIDVGCFTLPGNRYGDLNQDYGVVQQLGSPQEGGRGSTGGVTYVGAVLDGHGILGERVAQLAGDAVVEAMCRALKEAALGDLSDDRLQALMSDAFLQGHEAALTLYDDPPKSITYPKNSTSIGHYTLHNKDGLLAYRSNGSNMVSERLLECGTTCSLAVIQGNQLCLANVGDSTAVLGCLHSDEVQGRVLTVQHCGLNHDEASRIQRDHADHARILQADGYLSIFTGPWAGYELSVTRALGHKHLERFGVLCEPAVARCSLRPEDCCLIVATDGLWDVMDPREAVNRVMDVVSEGRSAREAAQELVEHAVALAEGSPEADADNTTVLVAVLG